MNPKHVTHTLSVIAGNAAGSQIPLTDDELVIGRLASPEGRLGNDPELSRRHARIRRTEDGALEIEDLGSTNGTVVNGRRITEPAPLRPGDVVEIGQTRMTLVDPAGGSAQPTAFARVRDVRSTSDTRAAARPTRPPAQPVIDRLPAPLRRPPVAGAGALLVALAAVALVVVVASSGDEASSEPVQPALTSGQLIRRGTASTVEISTRGPGFSRRGKVVRDGGGTGVVVDRAKGLVLTNAHVVSGQTSVKAQIGENAPVSGRVVSQAPCEDLALISLRPTPKGLVDGRLGSSARVRAGDRVMALGYPSAFEKEPTERRLQASEGIVSSPSGETVLGPAAPAFPEVIQHQAPLNPGSSGGPLLNDRGEVIGINTFGSAAEQSQNQNAAIAIGRVKSLLPDLQAGKNNGYVGWQLLPLRGGQLPLRPSTTGRRGAALVVVTVDAGSPADRRKLRFGDTIYEVDGTPVHQFQDVCDILNSKASGDTIRVEGYRFPPVALFGKRMNAAQAFVLRRALHFTRTITLSD